MRILSVLMVVVMAIACANAAPVISPANLAKSPAKLLTTTSGVDDWLIAATLSNKSKKSITAYKIGWAVVRGRSVKFAQGPWMNLPAGIAPGENVSVPAQNVKPQMDATRFVFFVSEVKFADASSWKCDRKELLKAARGSNSGGKLARK